MTVTVSIPTILRTHTGGEKRVTATGDTLQAVISDLEANYSGISERLVDPQAGQAAPLRQHLRQRRGRAVLRRAGHRDLRRRLGDDPARRRRRLSRRLMTRYDSLLQALGNTPLVGLHAAVAALGRRRGRRTARAAVGQARGPQPDRLHQGPARAADDRGRRARAACCNPARRSWSRRAATPASRWRWPRCSRATR